MKIIWVFFICCFAAAASLLFLGCEATSSADLQLLLNPRSASLHYGQQQKFTVSGGFDYRWSLSDETIGVLDTRSGNQVVYTDTSTNSVNQILTVQSFISGASGNNPTNIVSTNQVTGGAVASATIIQLAN